MINFSDIEEAFFFVSSDVPFMNEAVLNKKTGQIYYRSEYGDEDDFPEYFAGDDYIAIPHKNDLDLGVVLVFDFVREFIPEKYEQVRNIFHRRGAYRRYKDLLDSLGLLEKWYEYEEERTRSALLEWCKDHDLEIE